MLTAMHSAPGSVERLRACNAVGCAGLGEGEDTEGKSIKIMKAASKAATGIVKVANLFKKKKKKKAEPILMSTAPRDDGGWTKWAMIGGGALVLGVAGVMIYRAAQKKKGK